MSLGTSSGPPAALQLLIRVQQRSVTLLLHGDRMGPAARIPPSPPWHLQSSELNRLISIKKKIQKGERKSSNGKSGRDYPERFIKMINCF